jgi:tetratricopeptide (TPR) repeat protein
MKKLFLVLFLVLNIYADSKIDINDTKEQKIQEKLDSLQKPLYNPFVENYILNELKQLRDENRELKVEIHEILAKKEIEFTNNAVNYATSTINNMFYIIAAATSLLVLVGWGSIKDINEKITNIVNEKVAKVIDDYEGRMDIVEKDLAKRTKQVLQNQKEIEKTNTMHSLWMRASSETTLSGKIDIYNEILELRPDDVEAIIYKADAVLDMGEANWALNLTNQALSIDGEYADGLYQRAKVYSVLGFIENAIDDLEKAIELNEQYIPEIENEDEFKVILNEEKVQNILSRNKSESAE